MKSSHMLHAAFQTNISGMQGSLGHADRSDFNCIDLLAEKETVRYGFGWEVGDMFVVQTGHVCGGRA